MQTAMTEHLTGRQKPKCRFITSKDNFPQQLMVWIFLMCCPYSVTTTANCKLHLLACWIPEPFVQEAN